MCCRQNLKTSIICCACLSVVGNSTVSNGYLAVGGISQPLKSQVMLRNVKITLGIRSPEGHLPSHIGLGGV